MAIKRRSFSPEFKLEAVRRVADGKLPLTQVARQLGIHRSLLQHWCSRSVSTAAAGGSGRPAETLEDENRSLRRENAVLREEREILKKAATFFAKEAR